MASKEEKMLAVDEVLKELRDSIDDIVDGEYDMELTAFEMVKMALHVYQMNARIVGEEEQ